MEPLIRELCKDTFMRLCSSQELSLYNFLSSDLNLEENSRSVFYLLLVGIDNDDVLVEDPGSPTTLQPEERLARTRSRRGGKTRGSH